MMKNEYPKTIKVMGKFLCYDAGVDPFDPASKPRGAYWEQTDYIVYDADEEKRVRGE